MTQKIRSVAVIGGGASGAIILDALKAERVFDVVKAFERREAVGGIWRYDPSPAPISIRPGSSELENDPPVDIPDSLPAVTSPIRISQKRWETSPIYASLTTNVPAIAMTYSDMAFGPKSGGRQFVNPTVVIDYLEDYYRTHGNEGNVELGTTVEEMEKVGGKWRLVLRKRKRGERGEEDWWWEEKFDAVVLANGHYQVPFIPYVPGLEEFQKTFPGVVEHSISYREAESYRDKKVVVIGNRASGSDIVCDLRDIVKQPLLHSRRSLSMWESETPPEKVVWKPTISRYETSKDGRTGKIVFDDGSEEENVDKVLYATGYRFSFPFLRKYWPDITTGNVVRGTYLHTLFREEESVAIMGAIFDSITLRVLEYQAIAIARVFAGRAKLPPKEVMKAWEDRRWEEKGDSRAFHSIGLLNTASYWEELATLGGPQMNGVGRPFPIATEELWTELKKLKIFKAKMVARGIGGATELIANAEKKAVNEGVNGF